MNFEVKDGHVARISGTPMPDNRAFLEKKREYLRRIMELEKTVTAQQNLIDELEDRQ